MKTLHLLRAASLMLASTAVSAKTLEVTVSDIRNDKGNILVMAKVAGQEQPVYGMAAARAGKVVVTLEGIEQECRSLVGIETDHPGLQIDVADREARIIEQGGIVAREAILAVGKVEMHQCVVDPFRVQAKLWPARQRSVLRQPVHPFGNIKDTALEA